MIVKEEAADAQAPRPRAALKRVWESYPGGGVFTDIVTLSSAFPAPGTSPDCWLPERLGLVPGLCSPLVSLSTQHQAQFQPIQASIIHV